MAKKTIRDRSVLDEISPIVDPVPRDFPELQPFPQVNHYFSTVIFDFDGTMADSLWVWDDIDERFCEQYGLVLPDTYLDDINALSFEETAVFFREDLGLDMSVEEICEKFNELAFDSYAKDVNINPGVKKYLDILSERGVKITIATSLSWPLLEATLIHNGILDYIDDIAFCDECKNGKTESDVYLLAASRVGAKPRECLVFEDISAGLKSARRCGMTACAVMLPETSGKYDSVESVRESCDFWIESFEDLVDAALS